MRSTKETMRLNYAISLALLGLTVQACGGQQTVEETPVESTPVVTTPVEQEPQVSPEELERMRLEGARANFAEAAELYTSALPGQRDLARIETLLRQVLDAEPNLAEAWYNLGVVLGEKGDESGAEEAYRRASDLDPSFAGGLANLAHARLAEGDVSGARELIRQCLDRSEIEPGCNINLALMFTRGEEAPSAELSPSDAAIERLRFALGGDGMNADAYAQMAEIYQELGRIELARLVCENAILQGIRAPVLHNRLGLIALEQDDVVTAYAEFQRAVQLDPGYVDAQLNIGAMALNFRDYETALSAFEVALEERPDDLMLKLSYGASLRGLERYEEAKAQYNAVLERDPGNLGALYNMAVLAQEGEQDYAAACDLYQQFLASPGVESSERYEDVQRRFSNLSELIVNLADFGEVAPEVLAACTG